MSTSGKPAPGAGGTKEEPRSQSHLEGVKSQGAAGRGLEAGRERSHHGDAVQGRKKD